VSKKNPTFFFFYFELGVLQPGTIPWAHPTGYLQAVCVLIEGKYYTV